MTDNSAYTEEQTARFRSEIQRRRRLRLLSLIPFFVMAAMAIIARLTPGVPGLSFSFWGPVAYITVLTVVVYRIIVWRCPACKGFWGIEANPRFCPKCGLRIHE